MGVGQYRIIVAGYDFPIEWPTVTWKDAGGFNSHYLACYDVARCRAEGSDGIMPYGLAKQGRVPRPNRYGLRPMGKVKPPNVAHGLWGPWGLEALKTVQATVRQFVIHMDGCADPKMTFDVLHDDRGLSVHFILDNDGTIFQPLDCGVKGFQVKGLNATSIGIEMNNRGRADTAEGFHGEYYQRSFYNKYRAKHPRNVVECTVHGHKLKSYSYTTAQFEAMHQLDLALRRALPNIAPTYPQDAPGVQSWGLAYGWREEMYNDYTGWIGHYHTTRNKWDPGPFDFKRFFKSSVATRKTFPMAIRGMKDPVPLEVDSAESIALKYYENNESGSAGFFPVGRWGENRLWHTGVHLTPDKVGVPVRTPFQGRVVAVRNGPTDSAVGSTNFVLVKHEFAVGPKIASFFSLYFHLMRLGDPKAKLELPKWKSDGKNPRPLGADDSAIVLMDEPVEAGMLLGYVGEAGPDDQRAAQLHFSIFAAKELGDILAPDEQFWIVKESQAGLRYAQDADTLDLFDGKGGKKDGLLSRDELLHFFQEESEDREKLRKTVLLAVTEWNDTPDWSEALKTMPEFSAVNLREELIESQITPTLWWSGPVAEHAGLPASGIVYSYHPITFVKWLNDKLSAGAGASAAATDEGVKDIDYKGEKGAETIETTDDQGKKVVLQDDWDDKSGSSFADEEDLANEDYSNLTIEEIVEGYPETKK